MTVRPSYQPCRSPLILLSGSGRPLHVISSERPHCIFAHVGRRLVARQGRVCSLGPNKWLFFVALFSQPGRYVPHDEIIDLLWGDDPDGGPEAASLEVRQRAHGVRHRIEPLGLTLGCPRGNFTCAAELPALIDREAA